MKTLLFSLFALRELKADLELAMEKLKGELQRFILVSVVLVAIAQILVIKIWH